MMQKKSFYLHQLLNLFQSQTINCGINDSLARYHEVSLLPLRNMQYLFSGMFHTLWDVLLKEQSRPQRLHVLRKNIMTLAAMKSLLGDINGVSTPGTVIPMLEDVLSIIPIKKLAVNFHDTYGQSLSSILISLQVRINTVDSSVTSLGGCPYVKGASGNVTTEDVVNMLNGLAIKTNVDLTNLLAIGDFICNPLGGQSGSKIVTVLIRI